MFRYRRKGSFWHIYTHSRFKRLTGLTQQQEWAMLPAVALVPQDPS